MSKQSKLRKRTEVDSSLRGAYRNGHSQLLQLLKDPDLMEIKISYWRDNGLEYKAIIDCPSDGWEFTVIHRRWNGQKAEVDKVQKILFDEGPDKIHSGADPALNSYDSIEFKGF